MKPVVLIVDDEPSVHRFARRLRRRYALLHAYNANQARGHLAAHAIDAVVLDLNFPGARGFDLLDEIRAEHPALPVLVFTSHDTPANRRRAAARGAAFLDKSVENLRDLGHHVDRVLGARHRS